MDNKTIVSFLKRPRWLSSNSKEIVNNEARRLLTCGTPLGSELKSVVYPDGSQAWHGKASCRSSLCDSCTKIKKVRVRNRLFEVITKWQKRGGAVWFVTLTIPDHKLATFNDPATFKFFRRKIELLKTLFRELSKTYMPDSFSGYFQVVEISFGLKKKKANKKAKNRYYQNLHCHYHLAVFLENDSFGSDLERSLFMFSLWGKAYEKSKKSVYGTKAYPPLFPPEIRENKLIGSVLALKLSDEEDAKRTLSSYVSKLDSDQSDLSFELTHEENKSSEISFSIQKLLRAKKVSRREKINCLLIFVVLTFKMKRLAFSRKRGLRKRFDNWLLGAEKKPSAKTLGEMDRKTLSFSDDDLDAIEEKHSALAKNRAKKAKLTKLVKKLEENDKKSSKGLL